MAPRKQPQVVYVLWFAYTDLYQSNDFVDIFATKDGAKAYAERTVRELWPWGRDHGDEVIAKGKGDWSYMHALIRRVEVK